MKKNVGITDKIIRFIIAFIALVLVLTQTVSGVLSIVLLVVAGILILTSLISFCPLYTLFKINTCCVVKKR